MANENSLDTLSLLTTLYLRPIQVDLRVKPYSSFTAAFKTYMDKLVDTIKSSFQAGERKVGEGTPIEQSDQ